MHGISIALPCFIGAMKDHVQILKVGYMTLLPVCDEAGRSIIYLSGPPNGITADEVRFISDILFFTKR